MTKPIDPADLSAATPASAADTPGPDAIPFDPVPLRTVRIGWTAYRQRLFIAALAETGSVVDAAEAAGASARSAYRIRQRADGKSFAAAWDQAQTLGLAKLLDIAVERATVGAPRGVWNGGRRIGEEYVPSDRLLMFLLTHLQPTRFGKLSGLQPVDIPEPLKEADAALRPLLGKLVDLPLPASPDHYERYDVLGQEQ